MANYSVDGRGSEDQRILYDWLYQIYKDVIYEYPLPEINQRVDLYIPKLGIAVEYHGRQHYEYIEHFYKHFSDFEFSLSLDRKKENYLIEHGIKLVIVPYNKMVKSIEELKELIASTPYPDMEYIPLEEEKSSNSFKDKLKEKNKKLRDEYKSNNKEPDDKRKARLDKERQIRKERYKKMKELKKE